MNKEEIYDEKLYPLMRQCDTALLAEDFNPPKRFLDALNMIRPPSRSPLILTTRDAAGNITRMETIL